MKSNHSPLPWGRNIKPVRKYPIIYSGRNTHVVQMLSTGHDQKGLDDETMEANTDLVIKAVNNHYQLLNALKTFVREMEYYGETGKILPEQDAAYKEAKKAIAEAEK